MSHLITSTHQHDKHFTVTGYVMNKDHSKLLMIHHKKLNKWLPPGGHLELNEMPHEGAIREVLEETGVLSTIIEDEADSSLGLQDLADVQIPRPYALAYQLIPEGKKDKEHIHLDMIYRLEADDGKTISAALQEVHDVKWLSREEICSGNIPTFDSVIGFAKHNLL